jgi:membrane protease YdiL (CAAX protease family)
VALLAQALDAPPLERYARAASFALLSLPLLLLAVPAWRSWLRGRLGAGGRILRWCVGAGMLAALLPDRLARGRAEDLLGIAVYLAAALLLTLDRPVTPRPLLRDLLLVALLWLPLELGWVHGDFVLLRLFGLNLLLLLYVLERPIWNPGAIVVTSRRELAWGVGAWLAFIALAIPLAMATGFASPGISTRSPGGWALLMVSTFWVIALPEEALFRGVMQGLIGRAIPGLWPALIIASILFGLSHMNNATPIAPDWRYVALATLAGIAYGMAYLRTGNIAAPTLTHFLVDVTWRGFFAG